jgi:hypothetical protein
MRPEARFLGSRACGSASGFTVRLGTGRGRLFRLNRGVLVVSSGFDPYYQWLGIPPKDQPPNCYRLLGAELFETNPDVIESLADQRMAHVHSFQNGPHAEVSQKLLGEITAARLCLLNPAKKAEYDAKLRAQMEGARGTIPKAEPLPPPVSDLGPPALRPLGGCGNESVFHCRHCFGELRYVRDLAGEPVRCPLCGWQFMMPCKNATGAGETEVHGTAPGPEVLPLVDIEVVPEPWPPVLGCRRRKKRRKGRAVELVKIALGGAAGLAIGYCILLLLGRDPLGLVTIVLRLLRLLGL